MPDDPELCYCLHWFGTHTHATAPGAFPAGTRIRKVYFEKGDGHPVDTLGTVIGSLDAGAATAEGHGSRYFYFVEWDPHPRVAIGVAAMKIVRLG